MEANSCLDRIVVDLDENKFVQVITNLMGNAIKFTPSGGLITVSFTHLETQGRVRINVMDTGVGITPVHLNTTTLLALSHKYMVGEYRQAVSRRHTVLTGYSTARGGSWLGTLQ